MKKILSLVMALAMVLGCFAMAETTSILDTDMDELLVLDRESSLNDWEGEWVLVAAYITADFAEEYDVEDVLKHEGYIGFKTLPDYYRTPLGDRRYQKLFEIADAYSLALLVHTWGFSRYNDVEDMKKNRKRGASISASSTAVST